MPQRSTSAYLRMQRTMAELEKQLVGAGISADVLDPLNQQIRDVCTQLDRESREAMRFRVMSNAFNDWIWEVDADGRYTFVGEQVRDFLGYGADELIGRTPFDFMPPEEARRVREVFGAFVSEHKAFSSLENVNLHKDGRLVTLETSAVPMFDEAGGFAGYVGADRDVSEKKRVEALLYAARQENAELAHRMTLAVDAAGIGIWDFDPVTNELIWDEWMYRLYGVDPGDFSGAFDAWQKCLHPDDLEASLLAVEDALADRRPFDIEFRVIDAEGNIRYLRGIARVSRDEAGNAVRFTGINYDITERKMLELESERSLKRFRGLFDGIADAVIIADVETRRIVHCNHVAEKMLERTYGEVLALDVDSIHPEDVLEQLLEDFQEQALGHKLIVETELMSASGRRIPVSIISTPMEYDDRPALMGVFRDISESKAVERQILSMNRQLQATNQQLQASEQQLQATNQQLQASEQQLLAANQQLQASEQQLLAANQQLTATSIELRSKEVYQNLLTSLSVLLMKSEAATLDSVIHEVLGRIGRSIGADRCSIFYFADNPERLINTHEWCGEGILQQRAALPEIMMDDVPWWMEQSLRMQPFFVPLVSGLPDEASRERAMLGEQGIRSVLTLPVADGLRLNGFVSLDWVGREAPAISERHFPMLQLAADLIFTARNRDEASRRSQQQETRYRAVFDSIQDLYLVIDTATGMIEEASPSVSQLGYERDEVIGTHVASYYPYPEEREELHRELAEKGTLYDYEIHISRKDGSVITGSITISLQEFPGQGMKTVASLRDITLRKEHELRISENLRLKNDFISSVSHELRTPLFSIQGFSSTLLKQSDTLDAATRTEFTSIIHDESLRLSSLIEDLLTISRIESGKAKYKTERFSPVGVASAAVDVMRRTAHERQLELLEEYPDEELLIAFDRDSLKQIVMNLLGNALKFTEAGGRVQVRVEARDEHVRIEVEDDGIGIPEDELERIFEKFYRVERAEARIEGTGLGLAIVREIAEGQGGRVEVTSEPGSGSLFTLVLPLAEGAE